MATPPETALIQEQIGNLQRTIEGTELQRQVNMIGGSRIGTAGPGTNVECT